ncbi:MAG: glycosyltransferase family 1 protein [Candidatus Thermoplasmatota archaeon]
MRKIAIDCRCFVSNSGISRYLDNILKDLLVMESGNSYHLICPTNFEILEKYRTIRNVHIVNLNIGNDFYYKFFAINGFLKKEGIDIYWTPTQDSLLRKPKHCKIVVTVHDIAFEHFSNWFGWKIRLVSKLGIYKKFIRDADFIFFDSQFTKQDVERTYHISRPGLVTYMGTSEQFYTIEREQASGYIRDHFHVNSRYIFYLDTVRYKNLLKAFSLLISDNGNKDVLMVCLGVFDNENIMDYARELNIEKNVVWIRERVSDEALNNLYSAADFFISPSEYEGFGLTPLESLQCGTPVIVSSVTSLPEVFSDAALYCDPYDAHDIYEKMRLMSGNEALRTQLLSNADKLLKKYSWENTAATVLTIFNTL